ncbi:helix-turn-helix domain-containing protein [Nocardioides marmotae]|uniref:Helix-turn-helix domain-containing protein n=1 Tax=Nocardioides marmotae TaxID=2663857 RepID=A0A6I3JEG3_9ACTN|nr:helix-turn-helix domain-containing protein [Nocardioides marmotae]MCR6032819.1 helix-turn-helix domain-containing protein [Gordonia jinghuaiqii]MBC9735175.1 helix-turn-helix domain-containing protein [Nocardioides marmotae]MTB86275.1 helix-turn-helix domain-containing protein [Nocardioides marmotae]MTB96469.1 helix-turn-helix domain-containing protein [Nocardioides marmotae]QKE02007.1 helix-turn-helix domain-containing protein [Nocardioides marmotae]
MTHVTPAGGGGAPVAFSTAGLPEAQRIELWESHNAEALIGLRCRSMSGAALDATEVNLQVDRLHLARVRGSSHVVERDAGMVRSRPAESVALFFSLAGEAFFYHDDGVRTVQPGQMLLCDADRPFMRGFSRGLEELVLKVPRELFTEATGITDVPKPVVTGFAAGANAHAHDLARMVGAAARDEDPVPVTEQALLDLLAALTGRDHQGDLTTAHRSAAQAYIDAHLSDPSLSAAQVAAAVGLSTRHLSRVFAQVDTSVPRYVLGRRLELARRLLEKPAATSMTIAEIAHHCGFSSAAHFSHAFTTHVGERASDVRRRAVAARAVPLP